MVAYTAPCFNYGATITQLTGWDEKLYVLVYINEPIGFCLPELDYLYDLIVIDNPSKPVEFEVYGIENYISTDE